MPLLDERDACAARARLAPRTEALDRPDPGTTKLRRLEENIGGASVALSTDALAVIEAIVARIPVQGARYSADRQNRRQVISEP